MADPNQTISPTLSLVEATSLRAAAEAPSVAELAGLKRLDIDEGDGAPNAELKIERVLGVGGMGRIELGRQPVFGREVAVKRVRPDCYCAEAVTALLRESRFTGALEHPNIVPVHQLGLDGAGRPVLVMKRVDGASWRSVARSFSLERNLEVLRQVCNAIEYAHRRGVLHRDLKLENVMVGELGEVYVVDWGVALELPAAATHDFAGTPAYMAPEMVDKASPLDARTDVYLLGAMLHEVLTGEPRHAGTTMEQVLDNARRSAPFAYAEAVPPGLGALCNRACSAAPGDRPATALALSEAVGAFLTHRSSVELAERVDKRRLELEAAVGEKAGPERIRTLITETSFGFRQALEQFDENPIARSGLQRVGETAIEFELEQRNVAGAYAMLAALPDPRPELGEKVQALRAAMAAEAGELQTLRATTDKLTGARSRSLSGAVATLILGAASFGLGRAGVEVTYPLSLAMLGGTVGIFSLSLFLTRKSALANASARLHVVAVYFTFAGAIAVTFFGMMFDAPLHFTLAVDCLLVATGFSCVALWSSHFIFITAGTLVLGALIFLARLELWSSVAAFFIVYGIVQGIRSRLSPR